LSLGKKAISGSLLLLFGKVIQKSLGIISMLVLARFLTPEDFGIVAIATIAAFFFDTIGQTGTQQYIIQKETITSQDVNTAWTLNLLFKAGCFLLFIAAIPFITDYSDNTLLKPVLYWISLIIPLGALISPGLIVQSRNLNYRPITKLTITEKFVSICITIPLAVITQNYWAMIIGMISSYFFKLIISYVVAPYPVRLCFENIREQWKFSKWVLGQAIVGFSRSEADSLLTTRLFGVETLGGFNLMKNISTLPATEIIRPMTNPLLPAFSKLKNEPKRLAYQFTNCLIVVMITSSIIVGYIHFFHATLVQLAFDEKWWRFSPLLGILSLIIISFSISEIASRLLLSKGLSKATFVYSVITLAALLITLLCFDYGSILEFAKARIAVAYLSTLVLVLYAFYLLKSSPFFFSISSIFAFSFAYTSGYITTAIVSNLAPPIFVEFLVSGITFVTVYLILLSLSILLTWKIPAVKDLALYLFSFYTDARNK